MFATPAPGTYHIFVLFYLALTTPRPNYPLIP